MLKPIWIRTLLRMAVVATTLTGVSALYHYWVPVNSTTAALTLLLLVLGTATFWELPEAIFASIWSILCLDYYFLPPVPALGIDSPQNWAAWCAFLITSLVTSELSSRSKKRTREATDRQREIERLYSMSCALMAGETPASLAERIPGQVAEIFGCGGVAFFEAVSGIVHRAGSTQTLADVTLREVPGGPDFVVPAAPRWAIVPVSLGASSVGNLAVCAGSISTTTMQSIANLIALAMDRVRKQELASRAEASRRHQEMKSMLLDALAHEFQTPLTSIRAGVSAMLAESPAPDQQEWLEIMDQESARLTSMMAEAILVARVEAGDVDLDVQTHTVEDLVHSALQKDVAEGAQLHIEVPQGLPPVSVDAGLIRLVLRQLAGNARKYSQPGTPIALRARADSDSVVITVADRGPGIAPQEVSRIFEKYYRGGHARGNLAGMGMGLPIARQVIEAHAGRLWVESPPGEGAAFSFTLPVAHEEANA
jgi:two-component system sensor histidine kinase KdpD